MPLSTEVLIPTDQTITFPNSCPVCGETAIGEKNNVHLVPKSKLDILKWLTKKTPFLAMPIHAHCIRSVRLTLAIRRVYATLGYIMSIPILRVYLKKGVLLDSEKLGIVIGFAVGGILYFWIWPLIRPIAFTIRESKKGYLFDMVRKDYAQELERLNLG